MSVYDFSGGSCTIMSTSQHQSVERGALSTGRSETCVPVRGRCLFRDRCRGIVHKLQDFGWGLAGRLSVRLLRVVALDDVD